MRNKADLNSVIAKYLHRVGSNVFTIVPINILKIYEQQNEMYKNKTHKCKDRITSLSEPFIRPIVRGKVKASVEFGTKLDLSIDGYGMQE